MDDQAQPTRVDPIREPSTASKQPNPYLLAASTAVLAAVLSVAGSYLTSGFQARQAVAQKQLEFKVAAYAAFLERVDHTKAPLLNEFLNVGRLLELTGKTDGEIQGSEDRLQDLLRRANRLDIALSLSSDFAALKLHGSKQVAKACDDILAELISGDENVDWSGYSAEVQEYHDEWQKAQGGIAYGWEPKISDEERVMIYSVSKLMEVLTSQLRTELEAAGT